MATDMPFYDLLNSSSVRMNSSKGNSTSATDALNDSVLPVAPSQSLEARRRSAAGLTSSSMGGYDDGMGFSPSLQRNSFGNAPSSSRDPNAGSLSVSPVPGSGRERGGEVVGDYDRATVMVVELTVKKYTEQMLAAIEGLSGKLLALETKTENVGKSVTELRALLDEGFNETDARVRAVENSVRDVQRSVQVLRDKAELVETQAELARAQLASHASLSHSLASAPAAPVEPSVPSSSSAPPSADHHQQQQQLPAPHAPPPPHPSVPSSSGLQAPLPPPPPPVQLQTHQTGPPPPPPHQQQQQHAPPNYNPMQQEVPVPVHHTHSGGGYAEQHAPPPPPGRQNSMPPPQTGQMYAPQGHPPSAMHIPPHPSVLTSQPPPPPQQASQYAPNYGPQYAPYPDSNGAPTYPSNQGAYPYAPPAPPAHQPPPPPQPIRQAIPVATPVARVAPPAPSQGTGPGPAAQMNSTRVPVEKVIEDVAAMGFSRDEVGRTVRQLTENGQAVDLNVVLDRLMNGERARGGGGGAGGGGSNWYPR